MGVLERSEKEMLAKLESIGKKLREEKANLRELCRENELIRGEQVLELLDRIEEQEREFTRVEESLTELENLSAE